MRYNVEIYSGNVYCGNGIFDTLDECFKFAKDDGLCEKIKIYDMQTGKLIISAKLF